MSIPTNDRPQMPEGYGVPPETTDGLLAWSDVEERLQTSLHYWMATTRPDGRPHVVPRWGVWLDGRFWYDGSPATLHARNVAKNSACTLHLENGWEAVILDGTTRPGEPPGLDFDKQLAAAFAVKYSDRGYSPGADSWEGPQAGGLMVFRVAKALV